MGQAIDLPDPMQNPALGKGPSADDLLAQLAGEEIDRLLAEAEVERPVFQAAPMDPPASHVRPSQGTQSTASPAPQAFSSSSTIVIATAPPEVHPEVAMQPPPGAMVLAAPSAADPHTAGERTIEPQPKVEADPLEMPPLAPIAETDVEELDARIAKELDTLFTELNSDEPPPPVATPSAAATAASPTLAAVDVTTLKVSTPAAPPIPADPVAQAAELQRQVLGQTLMAALAGPEDSAEPSEKRDWLGMVLRPLEWLNRPLAACSDAAREALGKVAIMTLINAVAILFYVLFLRKH